ncbi:MAG: DNA recombination protein RmuC [Parvularculaceae bacterium]
MQSTPQTPGGVGQSLNEAASSPPLITGASPVLWTGFAAFVIIMALVFLLLARWRTHRRYSTTSRNTDFFQPAGEDAEITFEGEAEPMAAREAHADDDEPAADDIVDEPYEAAAAEDEIEPEAEIRIVAEEPETGETEDLAAEEPAEQTKKKKGFFFGLFGGGKTKGAAIEDDSIDAPAHDIIELEGEGDHASVTIAPAEDDEANVDEEEERLKFEEMEREALANIEREERQAAEERERAEEELRAARFRREEEARRLEEDRRREDERRLEEEHARTEAEEERRRAYEEEEAHRRAESEAAAFAAKRMAAIDAPRDADLVRMLSEVEEALHVQREAIQSETRNLLDAFSRRFSDRLDAIAEAASRRAEPLGAAAIPAGAAASGAFEALTREIADYRHEMREAISGLSERLDTIGGAPEETRALRTDLAALRDSLGLRPAASAPNVQLSDIVRAALAPNAYEFGVVLKNNRRADCLIRLPHPPGPIAVDARFPVEAFDALRRSRNGGAKAAEDEFKRVALRHIVDIAERLIAPDETADSALMFLPSETMFSELHARFPDIVQDAYRARVWIVSPTTLMATLHTIRAVMSDVQSRETSASMQDEAAHVLIELGRLRERVSSLEENFDRARDDVRFVASTTDEVYNRTETITRGGKAQPDETRKADEASDAAKGTLYSEDPAGDDDDRPDPSGPGVSLS